MATILARPFAAIASALVIMFATVVAIPASASAGDETPVIETKPDAYTLWAGTNEGDLPVWKNDPSYGDGNYIGAVQVPDFDDESRVRNDGGDIEVKIDPRRTADIIFQYKLVNETTGEESDWTEVTINVKKTYDIRVKQPRRGKIKLISRNTAKVMCSLGILRESSPDITTYIRPKSSRVVTNVHRHRKMYLLCAIGEHWEATITYKMLRNLKV